MAKRLTFAAVRDALREHGVTIYPTAMHTTMSPEWRVALANTPARRNGGYFATDLQDALDTGKRMAALVQSPRWAGPPAAPFVDVSHVTDADGVTRRLSNAVRVF